MEMIFWRIYEIKALKIIDYVLGQYAIVLLLATDVCIVLEIL